MGSDCVLAFYVKCFFPKVSISFVSLYNCVILLAKCRDKSFTNKTVWLLVRPLSIFTVKPINGVS